MFADSSITAPETGSGICTAAPASTACSTVEVRSIPRSKTISVLRAPWLAASLSFSSAIAFSRGDN